MRVTLNTKTTAQWLILVSVLAIALTGCNTNKGKLAEEAWYLPSNKPVRTLNDLAGYDETRVLRIYGKPKGSYIFVFKPKMNLMEYESSLYELLKFQSAEEKKKGITVKRMIWEKGDIVRIVWFRQQANAWVVVDGMLWDTSKIAM